MDKIYEQIAKIMAKSKITGLLILFLMVSYLSGQMWLFLVFTYLKRKTKGNTVLDNHIGKLSLGALWFLAVGCVLHQVGFQWSTDSSRLLADALIPMMLYGGFMQFLIFILTTVFANER